MSLGRQFEIYEKMNKLNFFLLSAGMLKLYFKNVVEIHFLECIKIDFFGTSVERHNADFNKGRFSHILGTFLKKIYASIEAIFHEKR